MARPDYIHYHFECGTRHGLPATNVQTTGQCDVCGEATGEVVYQLAQPGGPIVPPLLAALAEAPVVAAPEAPPPAGEAAPPKPPRESTKHTKHPKHA